VGRPLKLVVGFTCFVIDEFLGVLTIFAGFVECRVRDLNCRVRGCLGAGPTTDGAAGAPGGVQQR
jgi:hypothetical protein